MHILHVRAVVMYISVYCVQIHAYLARSSSCTIYILRTTFMHLWHVQAVNIYEHTECKFLYFSSLYAADGYTVHIFIHFPSHPVYIDFHQLPECAGTKEPRKTC